MAIVNPSLCIVTLNVSGSNFPIKRHRDIEWWNRLKNKIQLNHVFKRLALDIGIYIGWKWKDNKIYSMQMVTKEHQGDHIYLYQRR